MFVIPVKVLTESQIKGHPLFVC